MVGIVLKHGGTYDNTGTISGGQYGIEIYGGVGIVVNSGSITSTLYGVWLKNGGSVTNKAGGYIGGGYVGIQLLDGGSVTNAAGATIESDTGISGISIGGASGKVSNAGMIKAGHYAGVFLHDGGSVTNSGTIVGSVFVSGDAGSVTNSGTIDGSINFVGSGANTLTLKTGSVIAGSLFGSQESGATNTLVLTGAGTLSASSVTNFNMSIKASGTWTIANSLSFGTTNFASGTLVVAGQLITAMTEAAAATVDIDANVVLGLRGVSTLKGTIAGAGELSSGLGTISIANGAKITVDNWIIGYEGTASLGETMTYAGNFTAILGGIVSLSAGTLKLTGKADFEQAALAGSQGLTVSGSTYVSLLTVSNTVGFTDQGFVEQGGDVILGNSKGYKSSIDIGSSGTWDLVGDTGIDLGSSTVLSIVNSGLFEKTSGFNASVIAPAFVNNGNVLDTSGTLDFKNAVTGTGTDAIASVTAILEFDSTVSKTQTIDFLRPDGVLLLDSPTGFAAVLNGFDTIFTNDAVELLGSWSVTGYTQTNSTHGTLALTDGTHAASIAFDGNYSKTGFHTFVYSGQTILTYL